MLKALLDKDWVLGFLGGVVATILGFVLTMIWDVYKSRKDLREREASVLRIINEDLADNMGLIRRNLIMLQKELEALEKGTYIIPPPVLLRDGFWDIAKINLPQALLEGSRLLSLRTAASRVDISNEQIRSRESYRAHSTALSNFTEVLKAYDIALVETLTETKEAINAYNKLMSPAG